MLRLLLITMVLVVAADPAWLHLDFPWLADYRDYARAALIAVATLPLAIRVTGL